MFIVRTEDSLSGSRPAGKVIKAADWCALKEAERVVADALAKRSDILAQAQAAHEAERDRGYREGSEHARLEQSGNMIEIVSQTVEYFRKVETQMVGLVLEAVQKVVSDFDDRQRVSTVVRNCLEHVRNQKHLVISVHPAHVEFLRGQVAALQVSYPAIALMEIRPDARLSDDACIVETDIGIVEASLSGQVEVLRETLAAVFSKDLPEAG